MINKGALEHKEMSWESKGLWAYLMSRPNNWNISIKHLCTQFNAGKEKVYRMIKELISYGYCLKKQLTDKGRFTKMEYTVLEVPEIQKILPLPEKPDTVFPLPADRNLINKEEEIKNDMKEVVCSTEAVGPPSDAYIPILRECVKTHPNGSKITVSLEDVFRYAVTSNNNWTASEIKYAWNILCEYQGPVRTWERFIEGTIQNFRNSKKYTPITKKTQEKKCKNQNMSNSNNTSNEQKKLSSEPAMLIPALQNWISRSGLN